MHATAIFIYVYPLQVAARHSLRVHKVVLTISAETQQLNVSVDKFSFRPIQACHCQSLHFW